jgi:hypothetical protein
MALCAQPGRPDVVVLSQKIAGVPFEEWKPRTGQPYSAVVETQGDTKRFAQRIADTFYFYRCRDLPGADAVTQ